MSLYLWSMLYFLIDNFSQLLYSINMIKKIIEISGDSFLLLLLLGIIFTSAASVISMTPLGVAKNSDTQQQVLGSYSEKGLVITEKAEELDNLKVETQNIDIFKQIITVGPVNAQKFTGTICNIRNNSKKEIPFHITIKVPEQYKKSADFGIRVNLKDYILINHKGSTRIFENKMLPDSNVDIKILIDPVEYINYPITFEVLVEEDIE